MLLTVNNYLKTFAALILVSLMASCGKDDDATQPQNNGGIRESIDYSTLSPSTPYAETFKDDMGVSTVERSESNSLIDVQASVKSYAGLGISQEVDSSQISTLFDGIRNYTATSLSSAETEKVISTFEEYFGKMAASSQFYTVDPASNGQAGLLDSKRLVDENGIEWVQVIAKSLMGAFQLDYISNVLLDEGLDADNSTLVAGQNYTQLEHNWDLAYGALSQNDIYGIEGEDGEVFLGKYVFEYNPDGAEKIYPALLLGRAAIANNDINVVKMQAQIIRKELEKTLALAALGYLGKTGTGTTDGANAHAFSEGLGFIYSLRFCEVHGADAAFSDEILAYLWDGYWSVTPTELNNASNAIKSKFGL